LGPKAQLQASGDHTWQTDQHPALTVDPYTALWAAWKVQNSNQIWRPESYSPYQTWQPQASVPNANAASAPALAASASGLVLARQAPDNSI
jgi:hypothetical protein